MGSNAKTDVAAAAYATPRVGTRLLLATAKTNFNFFFFNLPNSDNNSCRDGRVKDQAELPRRLRGVDQQADQHGVLRLLCLSLYVVLLLKRRPGPARVRSPLCQGVGGGEGARDEADGLPEQAWRPLCLPGYCQAGQHGVGHVPRGNGGRPRAGEDGEPEPDRAHQGGGRQG